MDDKEKQKIIKEVKEINSWIYEQGLGEELVVKCARYFDGQCIFKLYQNQKGKAVEIFWHLNTRLLKKFVYINFLKNKHNEES